MMQATWLRTLLLLAVGMALLGSGPGSAAPLSPEACAEVESEHAAMVAAGLPELVKADPAGGAAAVSAAKAKEVARFIHLREQFLFRCGHDKKRATPATVEDARAEKIAPAAPPPPPPKRKPPAARKAPDQANKTTTGAPTKAGTSPEAAKQVAKPKPKPKRDDAYRPPPKEAVKSP